MKQVLPFGELAQLVSRQGPRQLNAHASAVAAACGELLSQNPLTCEEQLWLSSLAVGRSVVYLAREVSLSERSMYRRLDDVWRRLGTSNRAEGMALAASSGWIGPQIEMNADCQPNRSSCEPGSHPRARPLAASSLQRHPLTMSGWSPRRW